jgi:hypothetical protein
VLPEAIGPEAESCLAVSVLGIGKKELRRSRGRRQVVIGLLGEGRVNLLG